jgi:hypothetical protein
MGSGAMVDSLIVELRLKPEPKTVLGMPTIGQADRVRLSSGHLSRLVATAPVPKAAG